MREEKDAILKEVLKLLGEKYQPGLYEYLFKLNPNLYRRLTELEDRIDRAFLTDSVSLEGFKAILRDYWKLHMTAIKELKQTEQLDLDLSRVRQKMTEERVRA